MISIFFLILLGKWMRWASQILRLGNGTSWPGYFILQIYPDFIREVLKRSDLTTILVSGTNGKTTTVKMIRDILQGQGKESIYNSSGSNMESGIASALIEHASFRGRVAAEYGVFEVDERILPRLLKNWSPDWIVLLNLFRDQLDRYGEIDSILKMWKKALEKLPLSTRVILNVDDPQIAYLGKTVHAPLYFGLSQPADMPAGPVDALFCAECDHKLIFDAFFLAHLGLWQCPVCRLERPPLDYSLPVAPSLLGTCHQYNALAAALLASKLEIPDDSILKVLSHFKPAFGRQEIVHYRKRQFQLFLSKNPVSFNESLKAVQQLQGKILWIIVNRNAADGVDVSWLWDIHFENAVQPEKIIVSGQAAEEVGIRLKYAFSSAVLIIEKNLKKALRSVLEHSAEPVYVLPNYTAMLEVRKIIAGKKIP
ncbi:MAG: DUF1727 domain-containing protein [Verrucomicrobia bacterium]|nr:DUF1727 domain-containing protein [Verrucomicrobiota bacterium]